eukprot:TRINITY_DN9116_c2_g1_i1.p1 TRINITY_DN9116_c2_g1~~TRINITY_DN9116_c2_g1_i1.p1  ORF type:complete len:437 (-),score=109.07 TRINITY_DN9116_c2_g1_i1:4-1314(-)
MAAGSDHAEAIQSMDRNLDLIAEAMRSPSPGDEEKALVRDLLQDCLDRRKQLEDICTVVIDQEGGEVAFNQITGQLDRLELLQERAKTWGGGAGSVSQSSPGTASLSARPGGLDASGFGSLSGAGEGGFGGGGAPPPAVSSGAWASMPQGSPASAAQMVSSDAELARKKEKKEKKEKKRRGQDAADEFAGFGAPGGLDGFGGMAAGDSASGIGLPLGSGGASSSCAGAAGGFGGWPSSAAALDVSGGAGPSGGAAWGAGGPPASSCHSGGGEGWPADGGGGGAATGGGFGSSAGFDGGAGGAGGGGGGDFDASWGQFGASHGAGSTAAPAAGDSGAAWGVSASGALGEGAAAPPPSNSRHDAFGAFGEDPPALSGASRACFGSGEGSRFATIHIRRPFAEVKGDLDSFSTQFVRATALALGVSPGRIRVTGIRPGA